MELSPLPMICILVMLLAAVDFSWAHHHRYHQDFYTVAVYEHARQGEDFKDDPVAVIKANLEYYKKATKIASKQGADLILFPEYGLFSPSQNRTELKPYLESIPDPSKRSDVIPCEKKELFRDRQILYSLSCMARQNGILIVANMGGIEKCAGETDCSEDGSLHLNANVVFDKNGTLIARYYKERLFFELGMDLPKEPQNPVFDTELGRFATFICFDIIFEKMAEISRRQDVDAVLFSTMWMNSSPFFVATQWWQAFAVGNNATLMASNIQMPGWLATGSGVFLPSGENTAIYTLNPDGMSKLIVAKVPKRKGNKGISSASITAISKNSIFPDWKDEGKDLPEICSYDVLGPAKDIFKDYRCIHDKVENYTLAKLVKEEDHLELCHNGMCCYLDYEANSMNESYYFGVYNGTHNSFNRYFWSEENCFLARCNDVNGSLCSVFPTISHGTLFHRIFMTANFTTMYTYPSFLSNRDRLIPTEDWTFHKEPGRSSISLENIQGIPLIAATIEGRVYNKDPPYVR